MRSNSNSEMVSLTGRFKHHLIIACNLVLLIIFLASCSRTTPPGPNSVGGIAGQASYLLIDWEEGLRILIWDDIPYGGHGSSSSSSTSGPPFKIEGSAQSGDGRSYEYSLKTSDGQQVDFTIDGLPHDLSQGKLFLIRTADGATQVEQLDLDLSGLSPTNEGIEEFGRQTSEIAALMAGAGLGTPTASTAEILEPTPTAWDAALRTASALDASPQEVTRFFSEVTDPVTDPVTNESVHPLAGLVYRTDDGLWIVDRHGQSHLIINQPQARLSPDGRYVVFQPEYDPDIWLANLTTDERRNLTESSGRFHADPQWWPGRKDMVIFGSSEQQGPGYGFPTIIRTDGSEYRILDQEAGGPLALSPDGQMLAYGGFDQTGKIYHWDGSTEIFDPADYGLAVEKIYQPAWSPDGRQLAWRVSGNPDTSSWSLGIAVFDLETKTSKLLHTYTPIGGGTVPHYLTWSPSGDWLAFVTFNERAEDGRLPNLWIAQPNGQGETRLGTAVDPVWSPTGQQLAYSLVDDTQSPNVVWIYDIVTGERRQVLPAGSRVVDWLPPAAALFQHLQPVAQSGTTEISAPTLSFLQSSLRFSFIRSGKLWLWQVGIILLQSGRPIPVHLALCFLSQI